MRRIAFVAVMLVCGAGAAVAQITTAPAYNLTSASIDHRPSGQDFVQNYPTAAYRAKTPGIAVLCCSPRDNLTLACAVALEWPERQGFGAASLKVAEKFTVSREALERYGAQPGDPLKIHMRWQRDGGSPLDAPSRQVDCTG